MHIGQAVVAGGGRQRELELRQAVVTQAAAKADHRGLAHLGAGGDFGHRRLHKPFGLGQHIFADFAFGFGKGVELAADGGKHRKLRIVAVAGGFQAA
jgi:hypothetical protein